MKTTNKKYVKDYSLWLSESEANIDEVKNIINTILPIIRAEAENLSVNQLNYAKPLADTKNDQDRAKIYSEMQMKTSASKQNIDTQLSKQGGLSQTQNTKLREWCSAALDFLFTRSMLSKEEQFKAKGGDVSNWKQMYDTVRAKREYDLASQAFTQDTKVQVPQI